MSGKDEVILRGIPISKGVGIGLPIFFCSLEDEVPKVTIPKKEIDLEINRYRKALELSCKDVETLQKLAMKDGPQEIVCILGSHLQMMKDPLFTNVMEERIRSMQCNTESIFYHIIEEYKLRFNSLKDNYFQERVRDIIDVSRRILGHLRPLPQFKIGQVPHNSVILSHELVPSDTVEASPSCVSAFVTAVGGITSHVAIIARAKGIPYVANVDIKGLQEGEIHSLVVDGSQGLVILNPSHETLKKYQRMQQEHLLNYKMLKSSSHLKPETIDGYEVKIFANLEDPKEVDSLIKANASGVGLFRSEYLIFSRKAVPSEEEQFGVYKQTIQALKGRPLILRIFDIGGDKKVDHLQTGPDAKYFSQIGFEPNPVLGCRAIRFLLRYPEILDTQLRAILRASAFGDIHVLIPMISDVSEIRLIRQKVEEIQNQLKAEGVKTARQIPIGCMIEIPAAAIMSDALAEEADFISIGTNDLTQYVLAADRGNPNMVGYCFSPHPSILRLIQMVIVSANRAKKQLILCGECAADPTMVPLLIGLGIRDFSVAPRSIPIVKHTIRKWRILEASRLAEGALDFSSEKELREYLASEAIR